MRPATRNQAIMNRTIQLFAGVALLTAAVSVTTTPSWAVDDGPNTSDSTPATGTLDSLGTVDVIRFEPYQGPPIYLEDNTTNAPEPIFIDAQKVTVPYPNGNMKIDRKLKKLSDDSFLSDGVYREYHANGQMFLDGVYRDGVPIGDWTYYFANGQLRQRASHKNGQVDGAWEVYREDGSLQAQHSFRAGKKHGEWVNYDVTGNNVIGKTTFKDGLVDGESLRYYPNGKMRQQLFFKEGQRVGTHVEWDEQGNKTAEVSFVDGKRHGTARTWDADGKVTVREFRDGLPVFDGANSSAEDTR